MKNISMVLPDDGTAGTLVGRAWIPATAGSIAGPSVVAIRADGVFDLSRDFSTMSALLELPHPAAAVQAATGLHVGGIDSVQLLAPCDLQVVKAAGVTFAESLLERVIEEQAKGDPAQAEAVRARVLELLGGSLAGLVPGSDRAMKLKELLIQQGMWSQYLEVGIGPDAEVFTKVPVLSSVGPGAEIGIHPESEWNNPEPEIVLAVNSRGEVHGVTLGNDVNLRDFEGRSALLLSKAKDNNASCSIGPFIRLFDATFSMDDVRLCTVHLEVRGPDGFVLNGASSMRQISRDPLDLVQQTLNANHQYPDGFMLFLGTMFAPKDDRDHPGGGFTHKLGDVVRISTPKLGMLENTVNSSDRIAPWTFGLHQLFANLAARGLLRV
ncbi:MAG: fumarylacetoacetate hydrolase family protein [Ramlibacter sp.]|nr:fumarylacetoacetate hydrolase family protein [Ramlibacter sp.]